MQFIKSDTTTPDVVLFIEPNMETGDMVVMGTLPDGDKFVIITFHTDGTFTRCAFIPADSGFKLTMTDKYGVGQQLIEKVDTDHTAKKPSSFGDDLRRMQAHIDRAVPVLDPTTANRPATQGLPRPVTEAEARIQMDRAQAAWERTPLRAGTEAPRRVTATEIRGQRHTPAEAELENMRRLYQQNMVEGPVDPAPDQPYMMGDGVDMNAQTLHPEEEA